MSDLDIENLAEKIIEKLSENKHVCLQSKDVIEDNALVSKVIRDGNIVYSDILNAFMAGKGFTTWHNKLLSGIGLAVMLALGALTIKVIGLWDWIAALTQRK